MPPLELRPSHSWLILGMHTNNTGEKLRTLFGSPDDPHDATDRFDLDLANPPFNVNVVDKERLKDSVGPGQPRLLRPAVHRRPKLLWIRLFLSGLNEKRGVGFVMANSPRRMHDWMMEITEDVRQYGSEPGSTEEQAPR